MSAQDGGPAFPAVQISKGGTAAVTINAGMSLRDWFAGQAMAAFIVADDEIAESDAAVAAYFHADAMLKERQS